MTDTCDSGIRATIDSLLNDSEINLLADLFLACFELDRGSKSYRTFKNAVILSSRGAWSVGRIYELLSECCATSAKSIKRDVQKTICSIARPMHEMFNEAYAPKDAPYDKLLYVTMNDSADPEYVLGFLGTVFLYLVITNYPKYDSVRK